MPVQKNGGFVRACKKANVPDAGMGMVNCVGVAVTLVTVVPAPGAVEDAEKVITPIEAVYCQAMMSAAVSVPVCPSVVMVPVRVIPFCTEEYDWMS
jgi:hypothetical protein